MLVSMNFFNGEEVLQERLLEKAATIKIFEYLPLKLVYAIFDQIFLFTQNDSPLMTIKMFFISSKKLFSFSGYSNFCCFFSSFPHFPDSKGQAEVEQFMMSWIDMHKFADVIFEITQKLLYITSSNLVR